MRLRFSMKKFTFMEIAELKKKLRLIWDKIMQCEKAYPEDIHAWLTVMLHLEKLMFDSIDS